MFDFIRNNTRLMGILLALFIVPAFVLVGIDGYTNMGGRGVTVAVVAGQAIKQDEWDAYHRAEVDRIRAEQPSLDAKLFDTEAARLASLDRLVRDRVLRTAAQDMHLVTPDAKLARDLKQNEFIASLRRPDGTLDMDRYRQLLAGQGLTPEAFEAQVRQDLSVRQVTQGVVTTGVATPAVAAPSLQAFFEQRQVQWVRFLKADQLSQVQVSDAEVADYHAANPSQFQAEAEVDVEYVVLDAEALAQSLTVPDADIAAYYEQNAGRYVTPEERRASHILITAAATAPQAERDAARRKADELLAQIKQAPATFAQVAKAQSQDPGSAANGGDLGFFQRGAMVKAFEDAVFALSKGALSEVVETEFGFHIIQLTDTKASVVRPLAQVRAEIEAELKRQMAQRDFAEKADTFGNLVYEQANALGPVADKLKLQLQTANGVKRQPQPGLPPALADEKVLSALFAAESLNQQTNTEAIEVGANRLVAARVIKHRPARTLGLDEVKPQVTALLKEQKAQKAAREMAEKAMAQGKAGESLPALRPAATVSRAQPAGLQAVELAAALRADARALPAWALVDLGVQGHAVIKVLAVQPRVAPSPEQAQQELDQYKQWWTSAEADAYYNWLKKRYKVEIKAPRAGTTPAQG